MIASERRGHDALYFKQRWTMMITMTIVKRGIQGMIRRARESIGSALQRRHAANDGPIGDGGVEPALYANDGR